MGAGERLLCEVLRPAEEGRSVTVRVTKQEEVRDLRRVQEENKQEPKVVSSLFPRQSLLGELPERNRSNGKTSGGVVRRCQLNPYGYPQKVISEKVGLKSIFHFSGV